MDRENSHFSLLFYFISLLYFLFACILSKVETLSWDSLLLYLPDIKIDLLNNVNFLGKKKIQRHFTFANYDGNIKEIRNFKLDPCVLKSIPKEILKFILNGSSWPSYKCSSFTVSEGELTPENLPCRYDSFHLVCKMLIDKQWNKIIFAQWLLEVSWWLHGIWCSMQLDLATSFW